jgi:hypothetical protein
MDKKMKAHPKQGKEEKTSKIGQGFNDARGEVPDQEDIPAHNGQNVHNDPAYVRNKNKEENQKVRS